MKGLHEIDPDSCDEQAVSLLKKIEAVPQRRQSSAEQGRAAFLRQASAIKAALPARPPAATPLRPSALQRRWLFGLSPLLTILLVAAVILASTSTTVYAAQTSAPGHFLYPVKIASEDVRLSLASSSTDKVGMDIEFANRRLQEISSLAQNEKGVPVAVSTRWGQHLDDIFEHAGQMDDTQLEQVMNQLHSGLSQQLQTTDQLISARPEDAQLARLHNEIYASIKLVESGLANPAAFRQQIKAAGGNEIKYEIESMEGEIENQQSNPAPASQSTQSAAPSNQIISTLIPNRSSEVGTPGIHSANPGQPSSSEVNENAPSNGTRTQPAVKPTVQSQNSSDSENKSPSAPDSSNSGDDGSSE